jgi:LmbE family N-acetylglucosaminyl deacetylase
MKPTPKLRSDLPLLMAFGAHPDDIEFACGGVITRETSLGRRAHFVVCSLGESGSHGTPARRKREAQHAAAILMAEIEFIDLGGDAHFETSVANAIKLARILRRRQPGIVLGPSCVENQHPDHARLGHILRDAARLARYGGFKELRSQKPHAIDQLLYYAGSPQAEPRDISPLLIDVSDPAIISTWKEAMLAHQSQTSARQYVEFQLAQARVRGLSAGIEYAIALFPNDPPVFNSLSPLKTSARRF